MPGFSIMRSGGYEFRPNQALHLTAGALFARRFMDFMDLFIVSFPLHHRRPAVGELDR
jgi:hypothetical protein